MSEHKLDLELGRTKLYHLKKNLEPIKISEVEIALLSRTANNSVDKQAIN